MIIYEKVILGIRLIIAAKCPYRQPHDKNQCWLSFYFSQIQLNNFMRLSVLLFICYRSNSVFSDRTINKPFLAHETTSPFLSISDVRISLYHVFCYLLFLLETLWQTGFQICVRITTNKSTLNFQNTLWH